MPIAFKTQYLEESKSEQRVRKPMSMIYDETDSEKSDDETQLKEEKEECAERTKKYEGNTATMLHEELKHPEAYLNKVKKLIDLGELYDIADYYYTSETQKICPVLLKINNKQLLK